MAEAFNIGEDLEAEVAIGLMRRGEILMGDFVLRSGMWSPAYTDLRPTPSVIEDNPRAPTMTKRDQLRFRRAVVETYSMLLDGLEGEYEHIQSIPEAVCGITPMIAYIRDDSLLYRRVNQKAHGVGSDGILGDYHEGDRVVLVDDLISTSGAKVDEKNLVEDISRKRDSSGAVVAGGLAVEHAVILLDRETGGIEAAAEAGLTVHPAITFTRALEINNAEGLLDDRSFKIVKAFIAGDLKRKEDIEKVI